MDQDFSHNMCDALQAAGHSQAQVRGESLLPQWVDGVVSGGLVHRIDDLTA